MKNSNPYHGYRFPADIIAYTVWLYHRFTLSFRDIEELLAGRGILVSYESIRLWCIRFGPSYARTLRKQRGRLGDQWYLDEVSIVTVNGEKRYLWRAVDQDSQVIEVLVQKRKNKKAALRFFRKMLKHQGQAPRKLPTDKLPSYAAAKKELMPDVSHCQDRYANNRAEASHRSTREQERQMHRFKSPGQAQRFLSIHSQVRNLFWCCFGRHLLKASHYRLFRSKAFEQWQQATCAY